MSDADNIVSVKILDRSYKVKCPADEAQALYDAASYVNDQMRKVRQTGHISTTERVAVITALNISHEYQVLKKQEINQLGGMDERIRKLQNKISQFLTSKETETV